MPGQTTEHAFETYVEEILLTRGGWKSGSNAEWDKERALFPAQLHRSHPAEALGRDAGPAWPRTGRSGGEGGGCGGAVAGIPNSLDYRSRYGQD